MAICRAENPEIGNGNECIQKFNRFRSAQRLWKNSRVGCHPQELIDDVFGYKTGVPGCYDLSKKVQANGASGLPRFAA